MKMFSRIRNLREDKDLTQKEMAEILQTTQRTYSRYEKGRQHYSISHTHKNSGVHQVSIDYLLERTINKKLYK